MARILTTSTALSGRLGRARSRHNRTSSIRPAASGRPSWAIPCSRSCASTARSSSNTTGRTTSASLRTRPLSRPVTMAVTPYTSAHSPRACRSRCWVAALIARGPAGDRILADTQAQAMYVSAALQVVDVVTQPALRTHLRSLRLNYSALTAAHSPTQPVLSVAPSRPHRTPETIVFDE